MSYAAEGLAIVRYAMECDKQYNLPGLLYPQLLGLALGADPVEDLGLNLHAISLDKILTKVR